MNAEQQFNALKKDAVEYFEFNVAENKLLIILLQRAYTLGQLKEVQERIMEMKTKGII